MNEMRERCIEAAAKAIALCGPMGLSFTGQDEETKAELAELVEWWTPEATAAFHAILSLLENPSDEMVEAGQEVCGKAYVGHGFESEIADPQEVFAAMLNTIKEKDA